MDPERKKLIINQLDELGQMVEESSCDAELKNLFLETVESLKMLNTNIELAHSRLDTRKNEYKDILEEFKSLAQKVSESTASQKEQTDACKEMVNTMRRQIKEIQKNNKRQMAFTATVIALTLISMFGAVKGATTASSIWNVIKVLIP